MDNNKNHYYSRHPEADVKIHTISESLRRHLYIFKTVTGVFSFKKLDLGTKVLIDHMFIPKGPSIFLDLGCGYGPIGIVLAYSSPQSTIFFIDINQRAIWCTKENIKINLTNKKVKTKVLTGNYFEPIKNKDLKFDGIYINPPLRQGRKSFLDLLNQIPSFLKPTGYLQFVIKRKMGALFVLNYLNNNFSDNRIEILCKRSGYWVFKCFQK